MSDDIFSSLTLQTSLDDLLQPKKTTSLSALYADVSRAFQRYDMAGSGRLFLFEIKHVINDCNIQLNDQQMEYLEKHIDKDGISYDEFMSHIVPSRHSAQSDADTLAAWLSLGGSADKQGCIENNKIKKIVHEFGLTVEIDDLLAILDADNNGTIEYDEFKSLFEKDGDDEIYELSVNPLSSSAKLLFEEDRPVDSDDEQPANINVTIDAITNNNNNNNNKNATATAAAKNTALTSNNNNASSIQPRPPSQRDPNTLPQQSPRHKASRFN